MSNALHNVAVVILAAAFIAALLGGFGCMLWWYWFSGPDWALMIGLLGLPACFSLGHLASILERSEPAS